MNIRVMVFKGKKKKIYRFLNTWQIVKYDADEATLKMMITVFVYQQRNWDLRRNKELEG